MRILLSTGHERREEGNFTNSWNGWLLLCDPQRNPIYIVKKGAHFYICSFFFLNLIWAHIYKKERKKELEKSRFYFIQIVSESKHQPRSWADVSMDTFLDGWNTKKKGERASSFFIYMHAYNPRRRRRNFSYYSTPSVPSLSFSMHQTNRHTHTSTYKSRAGKRQRCKLGLWEWESSVWYIHKMLARAAHSLETE